ncbi:MAG: hypothetical protein FWG53_00975 [Clostridiales bacterium]|nr:hypothetical protein [Clostridiales bacterium]
MIERDEYQVPADAIEALARQLLPAIRSYFESEGGKAAFTCFLSSVFPKKTVIFPYFHHGKFLVIIAGMAMILIIFTNIVEIG